MNLRKAIFQVRSGLDGFSDEFWSDDEIILWLNEGAQLMCSLAQLLTGCVKIRSVQGIQEYVLPEDCDEVEAVAYNSGTLLRPVSAEQAMVQVGNSTMGIPVAFYMRTSTLQFMNHGGPGADSSSDIAVTEIGQNQGRKPRKVIGLYPIPSATGQPLIISYYQRHYEMKNDLDEPAIPGEFQRGWIDYAIALGKDKETAYAERDKKMASFKDYSQRLNEKQQNNGQEVGFHRMRVRGLNGGGDRMFGGSSWIYVGDVS